MVIEAATSVHSEVKRRLAHALLGRYPSVARRACPTGEKPSVTYRTAHRRYEFVYPQARRLVLGHQCGTRDTEEKPVAANGEAVDGRRELLMERADDTPCTPVPREYMRTALSTRMYA